MLCDERARLLKDYSHAMSEWLMAVNARYGEPPPEDIRLQSTHVHKARAKAIDAKVNYMRHVHTHSCRGNHASAWDAAANELVA